jgi:hypothetical protein
VKKLELKIVSQQVKLDMQIKQQSANESQKD